MNKIEGSFVQRCSDNTIFTVKAFCKGDALGRKYGSIYNIGNKKYKNITGSKCMKKITNIFVMERISADVNE